MLANGMQHQVIECSRNLVGRIIGRSGETINLMYVQYILFAKYCSVSHTHIHKYISQQKSQCRVQIDQKVPEGAACKVNIQGHPQAVQLAAQLVQEVMGNGPGRLSFMPSYQPAPVQSVPGGYYGAAAYSAQPAPAMYGYAQVRTF